MTVPTRITPQVLDVLDRYQVKATFFLIGLQARAHPELVRQIRARGHGIGNHSYSHLFYLSWLPRDRIRVEIEEAQEVVFRITGERVPSFPSPLGWVSNDLIAVCRELKLPIINGSVKAGDVARPGTEAIVNTVLTDTHEGDIIILHDAGGVGILRDRTQTLEALPVILDKLKGRGYRFVFLMNGLPATVGSRLSRLKIPNLLNQLPDPL